MFENATTRHNTMQSIGDFDIQFELCKVDGSSLFHGAAVVVSRTRVPAPNLFLPFRVPRRWIRRITSVITADFTAFIVHRPIRPSSIQRAAACGTVSSL